MDPIKKLVEALLIEADQAWMPPVSTDPAPGKYYEYHTTSLSNMPRISAEGLRLRPGSLISLSPHLNSVAFWSDAMGSTDLALLRMARRVHMEVRECILRLP